MNFLARMLAEAPEPMAVVATAPLTNIAMLLLKHREAAPRFGQLISMG